MATTDLADFLLPWTQNTAAEERLRQQQIRDGISEYNARQSDVFSMLPQGPPAVDNVIRWAYRHSYDIEITASVSTTTMTFSGTVMGGQTLTALLMQQLINVGTVLMRPSDGVQLQVSAVNYSGLTATVAEHGNSGGGSYDDDSSAITWLILGDCSTDDNETHYARSTTPAWYECGTQIHEELFRWLHTWENIDLRKNLKIANKVRDQVQLLIENMRRKIARSSLLMLPYYSTTYKQGDQAERTAMTGVFAWPYITYQTLANTDIYKDMSGDAVTVPAIDNLVYHGDIDVKCDYGQGNWIIACDPVTRMYISQFNKTSTRIERKETKAGGYVDTFITANGESFPIVRDRFMRPGTLGIFNTSDCEWGYMQGDEPWEKDLATQSRTNKKLITCQTYGVVHRRPDQVLFMYGLPTTFSG